MKKHSFFRTTVLSALLFATCVFYPKPLNSQAPDPEVEITIVIPIDGEDHDYCRCKFDGCYKGNMISFRPKCGHDCSIGICL